MYATDIFLQLFKVMLLSVPDLIFLVQPFIFISASNAGKFVVSCWPGNLSSMVVSLHLFYGVRKVTSF